VPRTASALNQLGIAAATGNSDDLVITTRNGTVYGVSLDGVTPLAGSRSAIQTQTGGHVHVGYSDDTTRLKLTDNTTGSTIFRVANALGSKAKVDVHDLDHDGNTTEVFIGPNTAASRSGHPRRRHHRRGKRPARRQVRGRSARRRGPDGASVLRNAHAAASLSIPRRSSMPAAMSPTPTTTGTPTTGWMPPRASALSASMRRAADTSRAPSAWAEAVRCDGIRRSRQDHAQDLSTTVAHIGDFLVGRPSAATALSTSPSV